MFVDVSNISMRERERNRMKERETQREVFDHVSHIQSIYIAAAKRIATYVT